jgi:hypothetical protein
LQKAKESGNDELIKSISESWQKKGRICRETVSQNNGDPLYFNSGCCCFVDGDITGIEIGDGDIRLIKWKEEGGESKGRSWNLPH